MKEKQTELGFCVNSKVLAGLEVLLNLCTQALGEITKGMDMRTKNLVINCFIANLVNATADNNPRGQFYNYGDSMKKVVKK